MKGALFPTLVLTTVMLTAMIGVVFPVATAQPGIDLTDGSEIALESMNVEMIPAESNYGRNGTATYNVTVSGKVETDGLPLLYPVRLTFYDVSDYSGPNTKSSLESSNDATSLDQTTEVLTPTNPDSFVPAIRDSESEDERTMTRVRKTTLAFSDLLNMEPSSVNKDVVVIAESIRSPNNAVDADEVEINGGLPEGFSSSTVQESNDLNILTDVSFVDSYRISGDNENPQFAENLELPSPSDDKLSGEIRGFNGMRSPFGNSTIVSGDNNISMVTRTGDIPSGRPYTLTVTYDISEGDEVKLRPINPIGQDITESSSYVLPDDPSEEDYCREISVQDGTLNMCNIFLNEGEVDLTSSLKELLVHYKADESTTISISCQSVISGYLPNNKESCGVDPADGEPDEAISDTIIDAQGLAGDPSDDAKEWTSPDVPVLGNDQTDVNHNLRYDVRETISGSYDSGDHVVRVFRQDEHVGSDGEILPSATPIYQDTVSDYDGEAWNEFVEADRPVSDLPERYHFLLCRPGSTVPDTCGIDNNVGHDDLTFRIPVSSSVDLDVKTPTVINPLNISNIREDQIDVRTIPRRIPDSDYTSGDWQIQNGGDPVIEGFNGTVTQEVTVNNVFEEKADRAQSGELLEEALDKRSDAIPDSEWDYEVSVTRTEYRDMVAPSSKDISSYVEYESGWEESVITEPRTVQVGTEKQNFPIVDGGSFSARVGGQERWYPLRNSGDERNETKFVFDTRLQKTDPDRCLNCLPTETVEDANARLGSSRGDLTDSVGTAGTVNAWQRPTDEPTIVNGREIDSQFFSRSAIVSNTLTYNNVNASLDNRFKYRQRQSEKESIRLYQYEYAPEILEPLFERPVTDQVQKYTRHRYDVTYTFTADVQNEDIYRYEKTVRDDIIEYEDRHIAWVDISRSSPTEEIDQFEVQFEGAEQPIIVDWIDGIHSLPPDERDSAIDRECDGNPEPVGNQIDDEYPVSLGLTDEAFSEIDRLYGLYQGNGGNPVVQRCTIDGEEKIVRVGQEYNETGIFSYDVKLISSGSEGQGIVEVIGEKPDRDGASEPQIGSEPEIPDVNVINDKVDYRIGTVPITGKIISQTNNLDDDYEVTVTPADNIEVSSVSCSELGGDYRSVMNKSVTDSYPSGASFRQVEKCVDSKFEDPSKAKDRFELFRTYGSDSSGRLKIEAEEVPAGAVQRCIAPFTQESGDCIATVSSPVSESNSFEYKKSDGTYKSIGTYRPTTGIDITLPPSDIEIPGIGYQCPAGYEMTREEQDADRKDDYSTTLVRYCQLKNPDSVSIDLRSRTASYQFRRIDEGIVTECSEIPTVGLNGNHDGYTDSTSSDGTANCILEGEGQGPSGFTLYSNSVDEVTGRTNTNYKSLRKGAFRGKSFVTGEEADQCNEVRIENDGAMICEYDTGSGTIDVRFGTRELGEWTSSSDTVSNLIDQTNSYKSIWQGENVAPTSPGEYEENFTTTINPQNAGISIDQRDVEFTIQLRKAGTGEVVQEENVEVRLCAAEQIQDRSELPRGEKGSYECENFDTMMTGEDDFQGTQSVSDAIEYYQSEGLDGTVMTRVIDVAKNDACPYTHEFPRDQSALVENTDAYTFEIQANNNEELREEEERIKQEMINFLSAQYSPIGENPCERAEDIGDIPTFVDDPANFEIEFNKRTFADEENLRFTRVAGLEDLSKIVPNPVQNRWTKDDMGSAVRLGHPILLKKGSSYIGGTSSSDPETFDVNDGLVAHYPFDHNTDHNNINIEHSYDRRESSDIDTLSTVPNHYVIQDVGMKPVTESPDGLETGYEINRLEEDGYYSEGIYNARLWYASPCHEAYEYQEDGAVYNPEVIQPVEGTIGPRINSHAFNSDPCKDLLTSEEAQEQLGGLRFDTNRMASIYRASESGVPSLGPLPDSLSASPDRIEGSTPSNQSAFLPVPPTDDWNSEYSDAGGRITNAYEAVSDNYAEKRGVFGGNALRLDKTSWMMITPPCHDRDAIGESLSSPTITSDILTGDQTSCDPTGELDSDQWRGGWQEAYTNPDRQLETSSIHNELGDDYTVSFWVNTKPERQSMSEVATDDGSSVAPLRSLYSTSLPVQEPEFSSARNANIMPTTSELSLVKAPRYISIEDLPQEAKDESDKLSGDRVKPVSWDYPGHFTLRDTVRACMADSGPDSTPIGSSSRPVMCEIFEESNSEYASEYDDLTEYEDETPGNLVDAAPFLEDFRREMISRTVWEPRLDWPVGDSVDRGSEGFPSFDRTSKFGDGKDGCYYATQRQTAGGDEECYDTGRYVYSDHGDISNIQADNTFGNSGWQHIAITYEKDSTGRRDFEIIINGELAGTPSGDNLNLSDLQERDKVKIGELYQGSVMSIGAVYQGPGYNMNPNDLDADESSDFIPYVHASQGEVLIDEMRIYNRELTARQIDNRLPDPVSPSEHDLPADVPMYTGELETNPEFSIPNGSLISGLLDKRNYRTFEVEVDAKSDGPASYKIDIIPCVGRDDCLRDASVTVSETNIPDEERSTSSGVSDTSGTVADPASVETDGALGSAGTEHLDVQLTGTSEIVRFGPEDLTDEQLQNISAFKLDMKLGTPYVDSSPIIQDIKLSPSGDPYKSCQRIAADHPGSEGLFGSEFSATILDSKGIITDAKCDMRTSGGNWTRFAWVDVSDGESFSKDIKRGDAMFKQDTALSDCDSEDSVCFSSANWNETVIDNVDSRIGPYPQVMVKAIDEGKTVDWASFQFSENAHRVIGSDYGVDSVRVAGDLARTFSGDVAEVTGDGPFDSAGDRFIDFKPATNPSTPPLLPEECLHPFDNSGSFDRRCISHAKQFTDGDKKTLYMSEVRGGIGTIGDITTVSRRYNGDEIIRIERNYEDNKIERLRCVGRDVERCEFYYRSGDNFDPFEGDMGIRGDAIFDLADYNNTQTQELNQSLPRGYTFSVEYDTKVTSLYSSYTGGSSSDWFIGLYDSDDEGNIAADGLIAGSSAQPTENPGFVGNNIDNETLLKAGQYYTIVQGKDDIADDGNHLGWSGPDFNMSHLLGENPVGVFKPASEGEAHAYTTSDKEGLQGRSPSLETSNVSRIGFDYEVIDSQFIEGEGEVIDLTITPDRITSGTVDYSVTNTITGDDVTDESTITSPIEYTSLRPDDLDGSWTECDEGLLTAQASWTDSEGDTHTDIAELEVDRPLGIDCPTWSGANQELVEDIAVDDDFKTEGDIRGFKIEPDQPIRVDSLGIGVEFVNSGAYDTSNIDAWGAIYEAYGGQPSNIVARTDDIGPIGTSGPSIQNYDLRSTAILDEGQNYILAVGGETVSAGPSSGGQALQYVLRDNSPAVGDNQPDINWGNAPHLNIVNNRALRWDVEEPGNIGESFGSSPDYILGKSPDDTDPKYPPNIRMNYEYYE